MRRASRGRLDVPVSWREVGGKDVLIAVGAPLESWEALCWLVGWVGGLGFVALAVAGGVDMPLASVSAAGEAIVDAWVGA